MNEQETIADIIAWLRRPREGENGYLTAWRDEIADRLEAAHKRECAKIEADALAVGGIVEAARKRKRERGDCAKLREALFASRDFIDRVLMFLHGMETTFPGEDEIIDKIRSALGESAKDGDRSPRPHFQNLKWKEETMETKAALSAPLRNCDKVKTSWEVLKEWHEGLDTAHDIVRLLDWLLAPATEKEGGDK